MAMGRVKAGWRVFNNSFAIEAKEALRNPVLHWLGWLFPLILFGLISGIFSEGTMLELPVSVVDQDHSSLSRQLIRRLDAGSHAQVVPYDGGLAESLTRLRSAEDYSLLYIPKGFEADVLAGHQPQVQMYYNALFYGAGLYASQDFSGLMADLNAHYRALLQPSLGEAIPALAQVEINYDSLFNASSSFIYYQQFAATIHLLQLFVVTCMIYVLDKRKYLLRARPFGLAVLGKLAPYTLAYTTLLMVQIAIMVFVFDANINGNPLLMPLVGFFYVMAAQCIGILLFTFTASSLSAYSFIGMFVSIAMGFSGMAVPELSMPLISQVIANIEPLTHALYAMFDIFLRDVPVSAILSVCAILMIYPLVTWIIVRKRLLKRFHLEDRG